MEIIVKITGYKDLPYDKSVNEFLQDNSVEWKNLITGHPLIIISPRVTTVSANRINQLQEETKRLTNIGDIDILSYYSISNVEQIDLQVIIDKIENIPGFKVLYFEENNIDKNESHGKKLFKSSGFADDHFTKQSYLQLAVEGIGIREVRHHSGNRGDYNGIKVIEEGCFTKHSDLEHLHITMVGNNTDNDQIGTAAATIIGAKDNGIGMEGIAPNIHYMTFYSPSKNGSKLGALMYAINTTLSDHTILLITDQHTSYNGQSGLPYEVAEDLRDAIKLAIARDIIVIQASGDGGINLDNYVDIDGKKIFDKGSPDYDKSDSILVAASKWDSNLNKHRRSKNSNFGKCISAFAQGEDILVGTKDITPLGNYKYHSGTGLAAAIVAGTVLSYRGAVYKKRGFYIRMRMLLNIWGFVGLNIQDIGTMPIMEKLFKNIDDVVDIYSRDTPSDTGGTTINKKFQSLDIIISSKKITDQQRRWGQNSGTDRKYLNVNVEYGQDNYCYVRVLNRSDKTAYIVGVDLYHNNASPLASPKSWKLIGQTTLQSVEPDILTVSPAIKWSKDKIPHKGHYCFIAILTHIFDPPPNRFNITNSQEFKDFIRYNNNAVWRNFNIIDNNSHNTTHPSKEINESEFELNSFYQEPYSIIVNSDIPEEGLLQFEFQNNVAPYISGAFSESTYRPGFKVLHVKSPSQGTYLVQNESISLKEAIPFKIQYRIPYDMRGNEYVVELVQYYHNEVIGRITWLIKATEGNEGY